MYLGICISDSCITAGVRNQDGEVVLIRDESSEKKQKYNMPLTVYIDDNFAYVGSPIDYLIANDHTLSYSTDFTTHLANSTATIYTDKAGTKWNAISVLAIVLKKLETDIQVYSDEPIQGVMVTINQELHLPLIEALQMAFHMVDIPLCGVIEMGKAALLGYQLITEESITKHRIHAHIDTHGATISIIEEDKTIAIQTDTTIGITSMFYELELFLQQQYEEHTGTKIQANHKNKAILNTVAQKILTAYDEGQSICSYVHYPLDPIVSIMVTKTQIEKIITSYLDKIVIFLEESIQQSGLHAQEWNEILLTGCTGLTDDLVATIQQHYATKNITIHYNEVDQILAKGATHYANNTIEREISQVLLVDIKERFLATKAQTKGEQNWSLIHEKIKTMHINMGCDA